MSYKIAISSSDEEHIDKTFGSTSEFIIYEVTDGKYRKLEKRTFHQEQNDNTKKPAPAGCNPAEGCAVGNGCGNGGGCGGQGEMSAKVDLLSDCRCVVCTKIGFNIQKLLERKAISAFDVSCSVEEALAKITYYFSRIDNHESLRGHR